ELSSKSAVGAQNYGRSAQLAVESSAACRHCPTFGLFLRLHLRIALYGESAYYKLLPVRVEVSSRIAGTLVALVKHDHCEGVLLIVRCGKDQAFLIRFLCPACRRLKRRNIKSVRGLRPNVEGNCQEADKPN